MSTSNAPSDRIQIERIPLPVYDGIKLPTFNVIRSAGQEHLDTIRNLESRESDILLCSYMKSGFNWTSEIIGMLLKGKSELADNMIGSFLEMSPGLKDIESVPDPRFLKTHLPLCFLPKKHIDNKYRIIHVVRNPKDLCVSMHHHTKTDPFTNMEMQWAEFLEKWLEGDVPYGSWFNYMKEFEDLQKKMSPDNFLLIYYEDVHLKPKEILRQLAKFLGVAVNDDQIEKIIAETKFSNMSAKKKDPTSRISADGKGFIYRKGTIGDWKNHFTVAENERLDKILSKELQDTDYNFVYKMKE